VKKSEHYSLVLYYGYVAMLADSFLFMSSSGMLGREDHAALRFIVTAAGLFGVWTAAKLGRKGWAAGLIALTAVFNPVWHPHVFSREAWMGLDLLAVGFFIASLLFMWPRHFEDGEPAA